MGYWNKRYLNKLESNTRKGELSILKISNEFGRFYFYFKRSLEKYKKTFKVLFFSGQK
jgi:hypothetical protein